jgi:hypothetical protein
MVFKHMFRKYKLPNTLISIHFNKKYKDVMRISMYCFCIPSTDMLNHYLGIAGLSSHESGLPRSRGSRLQTRANIDILAI